MKLSDLAILPVNICSTAQESAAAAEQFAQQAEQLEQVLMRFKLRTA